MRRLAHWLFNTLTVLSLLSCVLTLGLWVRSYHACDDVDFKDWEATSDRGQLFAARRDWSGDPQRLGHSVERTGQGGWFFQAMLVDTTTLLDVPGLRIATRRPPSVWRIIVTRHSCVAALFLAWPSLSAISLLRRRRRRKAGLCPRCSYDLTANASGVCPECGTSVQRG